MADTKTILLVRDGTVVDAHLAPGNAVVVRDGSTVSWDGGGFPAMPGLTYFDQADATIGWVVKDGALVAPPEPEPPVVQPAQPAPVPQVISRRQFFQQIANDGDATEDEALAAVQTGTLPAKLTTAIASLPADQQFPAKMLICGATEFQRSNPMVPVLGEALGKDAAALDAIWTAASAL